jgi:poly(3-hydroxybutyrate) depolymerase
MEFYDEYLAVEDMSGRFYIDTVDHVFKRQSLAKGEMVLKDQRVDLSALKHTALLTVEGERDDISAPGQTLAAHNLCNNITPERHYQHLQPKVGHYGIFEGRAWREEISPRVAAFIRKTGVDNGLKYSEIPPNTRLMPPNLWHPSEGINHPAPTP